MNEELEKSFVKIFVLKNKQTRMLFELSKMDKRAKMIDRFSHNINGIIKLL